MSNLHRIQWIDRVIRSGKYPNCSDLATEFCISVRQASRDVEYLRYSLGAPVEYSPEKKGYYYTDESFILPAVMISQEEKLALSYLAEQYKSVHGQMATQLALLFERLSGKPSGEEGAHTIANIPVYAVSRQLMDFTGALQAAVKARLKVKIAYISYSHEISKRTIHPLLLFSRQAQQYLAAWCESKNAERTFLLKRIRQLEVTTENFSVPAWFNAAKYSNDYRFDFRIPYTAEIRFDGFINPGKLGLRTEVLNDGCYRIFFFTTAQLFAALIAQAVPFIILTPAWLKRKFNLNLSDILKKNF